ncbi:MAG: carboxyl-terminal processing protease [Granulosicoccus sp.]|jgi:carboxyl-terminal processing protease
MYKSIVLPVIVFMSLFLSGMSVAQDSTNATEVSAANDNELPLKELRLFTLIFDHIRRAYVEPISDQQLLENAIKGMMGEMDPHSAYLDASSFEQLQESTQGEFTGIGIEMGGEDGFIKVISPIDGSPAQKAGIQAGDIIIKVDQESIQGLSVSEAAKRIRGPVGTPVEFTIIRANIDKPLNVTVVRDKIKSLSIRQRVIEDSIAYIRIAQFQSATGKDFVAAIKKLRNDTPTLNGLIIDLRNNPGGILQSSVQVVDALIDEGTVVYTKGRIETSNVTYSATAGDETMGLPIVVLINGGSASASEIVAGALQDHQRAVIMGTRSFGKGSVQTILPVGEKKGIKLTTARYFTPNGRSIQAQGIAPDIIVEPATITALQTSERISEASLGGHLKNNTDSDETVKTTSATTEPLTKDNQLFEAINLLKGLAILTRKK